MAFFFLVCRSEGFEAAIKKQSGGLFFAAGKRGECACRAKRNQAAAEAENPSGRTTKKRPYGLFLFGLSFRGI